MLGVEFLFKLQFNFGPRVKSDLSDSFSCSHDFLDSIFVPVGTSLVCCSAALLSRMFTRESFLIKAGLFSQQLFILTNLFLCHFFCKMSFFKVRFLASNVLENAQHCVHCSLSWQNTCEQNAPRVWIFVKANTWASCSLTFQHRKFQLFLVAQKCSLHNRGYRW